MIEKHSDQLNRLAQAAALDPTDGLAKSTNYGYDAAGNLAVVALPNTVSSLYAYDSLNRLQNLTSSRLGTLLASHTYSLDASGHRTGLAELSGRQTAWNYDSLYRLTNESVAAGVSDPAPAGSVSYALDKVGNRQSRASSLAGVGAVSGYIYDSNDRLTSADSNNSTYDANGNTKTAMRSIAGVPVVVTDGYDDQDRLIQRTDTAGNAIDILYDADGNRIAKTVNGTTTYYLVDTQNLTGYAQVIEELAPAGGGSFTVNRTYAYGMGLISQAISQGATWQTRYFGYDGHGSVCFLTDASGTVTDTFAYDAFGNLVNRTGATANNYLYCGEQFDGDLAMYYLRARYMNPDSGRFWNADSFEGLKDDPQSLHRYIYASADPVVGWDPSGQFTLVEAASTIDVSSVLDRIAIPRVVSKSPKLRFFEVLTEIESSHGLLVPRAAIGIKTDHAFNVDDSTAAISNEYTYVDKTFHFVYASSTFTRTAKITGRIMTVTMTGEAKNWANPFLSSIGYNYTFNVNLVSGVTLLTGMHKKFPSYTVRTNKGSDYFHEVTVSGLYGKPDIPVHKFIF